MRSDIFVYWQKFISPLTSYRRFDGSPLFAFKIEATAQQLYQDPQWQEMILVAAEILGIEDISHKGILIRLLIKTQPLQQRPVCRELRRRLKKVFDEQGININ